MTGHILNALPFSTILTGPIPSEIGALTSALTDLQLQPLVHYEIREELEAHF